MEFARFAHSLSTTKSDLLKSVLSVVPWYTTNAWDILILIPIPIANVAANAALASFSMLGIVQIQIQTTSLLSPELPTLRAHTVLRTWVWLLPMQAQD